MSFHSRRPAPAADHWRAIALIAVLFATAPSVAHSLDWGVGTRFGFETQAAAFDDPYAFSTGIGIFADLELSQSVPLRAGVTLSRYTFASLSPAFSSSSMPTPGIYFAYPVYRVVDDSIEWWVEPFFEYRHYRRTHRFLNTETISQRPLTAIGLRLISVRRFGISTGVAAEYQTVWDNQPVHRAAVLMRLGFRSRNPVPAPGARR